MRQNNVVHTFVPDDRTTEVKQIQAQQHKNWLIKQYGRVPKPPEKLYFCNYRGMVIVPVRNY